ncbi:MAG: peroxide stress protein YaaA [Lachnospiraceae bacterium]|nr:peroxide stress protein YaaA [Lachnospiraceae bacterium]
MKIIISPAKKMNVHTDLLPGNQLPEFLSDTEILYEAIQKLALAEAKALWNCNDKLAQLNFQRHAKMDLRQAMTPALLSYEGLQYQHMAPSVFTREALSYVEKHLRILSGFYGILKPFDRVTPYRLEFQAPLSVQGKRDLYDFWGDKCYRALIDKDRTILNLASKEYSKIVEKYLQPEDRFITLVFGELVQGKLRQKGTLAKMARGEMVRYLAEGQVTDLEQVKAFHTLNYTFTETYSTETTWVFLR